jgi:hypothetical protein
LQGQEYGPTRSPPDENWTRGHARPLWPNVLRARLQFETAHPSRRLPALPTARSRTASARRHGVARNPGSYLHVSHSIEAATRAAWRDPVSRTRLIKPSFFKHYELYQAEVESGLPLRVAYAGLWTVTDRAGRFRWKGDIKTDVLPYDPHDILAVLDALERYGFVRHYVVAGKRYGFIPSFHEHQSFHKTERASTLPPPPKDFTVSHPLDNGEELGASLAVTGTGAVTVAGAVSSATKGDPVDLDHPPAAAQRPAAPPITPSATATASPSAEPRELHHPEQPNAVTPLTPNERRILRDK